MTPSAFFEPKLGQSLLIPGQKEIYRGQCVQSVGLWVQALGLIFPSYLYAYLYYTQGIPGYDQVPKGSLINTGDTVIFASNLPGSYSAGHICVAKQPGHPLDFTSYDSNWAVAKKLEVTRHMGGEDTYILGYLRLKGGSMGIITTEAVVALSLGTQGTQPQSPDEYAQWVGKSDQQSWDDLITHYSQKGQARQAALEAQLASGSTVLKPGKYLVQ